LYVTVHNYTIGSGSQLDVGREAQLFASEAASIEGFRAYYMIDAGDSLIATVAVFDTREGIEECDRRAARFVEEKLAGFQLSDVEVREGQVLASQMSFAAEAAPAGG
jgi:hypothetical protein